MEAVTCESIEELKKHFGPSLTLIDFYATWCGPCKTLAPQLDDLLAEYSGKVKGLKIDVDESEMLAELFAISSMPTIMIFQGVDAEKPSAVVTGNNITAIRNHVKRLLNEN